MIHDRRLKTVWGWKKTDRLWKPGSNPPLLIPSPSFHPKLSTFSCPLLLSIPLSPSSLHHNWSDSRERLGSHTFYNQMLKSINQTVCVFIGVKVFDSKGYKHMCLHRGCLPNVSLFKQHFQGVCLCVSVRWNLQEHLACEITVWQLWVGLTWGGKGSERWNGTWYEQQLRSSETRLREQPGLDSQMALAWWRKLVGKNVFNCWLRNKHQLYAFPAELWWFLLVFFTDQNLVVAN